jgi:hypothetical protein
MGSENGSTSLLHCSDTAIKRLSYIQPLELGTNATAYIQQLELGTNAAN